MTEKLCPRPILGYTDTETVKLEFDGRCFRYAKDWAFRTLRHFRLGGFVILKSSRNNYHVVFDRPVSWKRNVAIVAWVCLITKHRRLTEWLVMQLIKQASTLRVSPKNQKAAPRIVCRHGTQNRQVGDFLSYRKLVKNVLTRL
ncbi:hypothetical protein MUP77_19755 [Candidatus Bathyarchaeota archaeon]|nr:hypothetical protein [Candidatus Bathyarchaeota archaeon]